jgi:hypothetical protein
MRQRLLAIVLCASAMGISVGAQQPKPANKAAAHSKPAGPAAMTNADVIKMVKGGLSESLIIAGIKQADKRAFTFNADSLILLKTAGVSENIIRIMLDPSAASEPVPPAATAKSAVPSEPTPAAGTDALPVAEIGVYYRNGDQWADLLPEVVNWKTGGVLKHLASAGVIKGDINGLINGPSSKTILRPPIQVLIYTPEGVAITEYQLLKLRQNGDTREFRTVTGGLMHAESGATRDLMPFESKKIAARTHALVLPALTTGEYGILSPGAASSSSASAQLGKIYSFRIQSVETGLAATAPGSDPQIATDPKENVRQQLQTQYAPTRLADDATTVTRAGAILVVQKEGVGANTISALGIFVNSYKDGHIKQSLTSRLLIPNDAMRTLQVGEKVYVLKVEVKDTEIVVYVQPCGSCNPTAVDANSVSYKSAVAFQFPKGYLRTTDVSQIQETISQVLAVAPADPNAVVEQNPSAADESGNAPTAPQAAPGTIEIGQTTDQVVAAMGPPGTIVKLGTKEIYVYKDLKVTFLNGRVSEVE